MDREHVVTGLALLIVLGIVAQWVAWRLRLPSILVLLTVGFVAGPITGLIDPDALLGPLLFPLVSMAVGLIMFEGALGLRLDQIRSVGMVIRRLITVGMLVTWALSALAAHLLLGFPWPLAALLGAVLVVTGPTVIIPLLRHVKPVGAVGPILRWEGILIDPVGATLALLVFEFIRAASPREAATGAATGLVLTIVVGTAVGLLGAGLIYIVLKRYWLPDYLQNPAALMTVIGAFALSDTLQHESGLLAVTVMGVALANQRHVPTRHIVEFKENLGVLLLASLFILLAARLDLQDLTALGGGTLAFIAVLMLVIRPAAIVVSTLGSPLAWRERLFLAWMAPRGIVAAAVTSIFALGLTEAGYAGAEQLVPVMFAVIVVSVSIYGLTALPLARRLGIAPGVNPQGVLIVGAHGWARDLARELRAAGFPTLLVDTNYENIQQARMMDLPVHYGNILAESASDEVNLDGLGRLISLTSNDEVNALAALHFADVFGRVEVYQLPIANKKPLPDVEVPHHLHGRFLFEPRATFRHLDALYASGAVIKTTRLTPQFDYATYRATYGESVVPLFLVGEDGRKLTVVTAGTRFAPAPGQSIISLALPPGNGAGVDKTPRDDAAPAARPAEPRPG